MSGELRWVDPRELREAEENPRTISDGRYEDLLYTLRGRPELLEARPVVVDVEKGDVPCGNMRLRGVLELIADQGEESPFHTWLAEHNGQIPAYYKTFRDAAERREWVVLDNEGFGEWVPDELALLVTQHKEEGSDLRLLGMSELESNALLRLAANEGAGNETGAGADDVPRPTRYPLTLEGEVWQLGEHRLCLGRAEDPGAITALFSCFDTPVIDLIWTDPPYNVDYDAESRVSYFSEERKADPFGKIEGDKMAPEDFAAWLKIVLENISGPLIPGGAFYICHADKMVEYVTRAIREVGLKYVQQLIWQKTVLVFGRSDYHFMHEPIVYGWKPGAAHRWLGDRKQTTLIEAASDHYNENKGEGYEHPNQKPYELIRPAIVNSTEPGQVVLDPFAGSGSTLIACEQLGRRCLAIELDTRYGDVILERYRRFALEEPVCLVSPTAEGRVGITLSELKLQQNNEEVLAHETDQD